MGEEIPIVNDWPEQGSTPIQQEKITAIIMKPGNGFNLMTDLLLYY